MKIFVLLVFMCLWTYARAIGPYTDPTRALTIKLCSESAEKSLKTITATQVLNGTGHKWLEEDISKITSFQREFNNYLDNFRVTLATVAEVYGIYLELNKTVSSISNLEAVVSAAPANTLAVAFSSRRSNIYQTTINVSMDLLEDIRTLFLKKSKMTGQQRQALLSDIRPKLRSLNKHLRMLALYIKYTSFKDVWREIANRSQTYVSYAKKKDIAERCLNDWKRNIGLNE